MATVGRLLLVGAAIAAPWPFGAVQPWPQFLLAATIIGLCILRAIEAILYRPDDAAHIPAASLAPLALLIIAAIQLLPRAQSPPAQMEHAVFSEQAALFTSTDHAPAGTLSAASTRREAARLYFALAAFLLASQWFASTETHRLLYITIAANGAALGAFGIIQAISWNGMLFWSVELRYGGTPFASFVNRNNATGYLNLCLAAAVGWMLLVYGRTIVGGGERTGRKLRISWRDRVKLSLAEVQGEHLAVVGLIIVMVAAITFSLSRGGILGMAVAGLAATALAVGRAGWRWLVIVLVMIGAASVGLLQFVGQFETVDERLTTLRDPLSAAAGRLDHWSDTLGAVKDFPVLGSGFGTYRYANQPYQSRVSHAWYYNADNEWFELLVETGSVGLAAVMLGLLLVGISSLSLLRRSDVQWRAVGAMGLFATVSQFVQGVTDFGLIIPANGVMFAVICGTACGAACKAAQFHQLRIPISISLAQLDGRVSQALLNFAMLVAGAAFLLEMYTATTADAARDRPVALDEKSTRLAAIESAIADAADALRFRPDDGELHQAIGKLWINRCRLQMYQALIEEDAETTRSQQNQIWRAVSLGALSLRARQLEAAHQEAELARLRQLSGILDNLPRAAAHFAEATRHCPLARGAWLTRARLSALVGPSADSRENQLLEKAVFCAPSSPDSLIEAGTLASVSGLSSLADSCWHRALIVSLDHAPLVWEIVSQTRAIEEVIGTAIPRRSDILVEIAEQEADERKRGILITEAAELVDSQPDATSPLTRAKLADLQSDADSAIMYYRLALETRPWDIDSRWRLARLLHSQGQLPQAESEYSVLSQQVPNSAKIEDERRSLQLQILEAEAIQVQD